MADIRVLFKKCFDIVDSYEDEKKHFNELMSDSEDVLSQMIESADEPLKEALRLSRIGNYIDFGAMNEVSDKKLAELFAETENDVVDEKEWTALKGDLEQAVKDYLGGRRIVCLTGVLADKDWQQMMGKLQGFASDFITVSPDSPRALTNTALAAYLTERGCTAQAADNVAEAVTMALKWAKETGGVVVACGSLYMASEVREFFGRNV